jgi:hypothetical protein
MHKIIVRLDKLSALRTNLNLMHEERPMGSTAAFIAMENENKHLLQMEDGGERRLEGERDEGQQNTKDGEIDERRDDVGPVDGPRLATPILLSKTTGEFPITCIKRMACAPLSFRQHQDTPKI